MAILIGMSIFVIRIQSFKPSFVPFIIWRGLLVSLLLLMAQPIVAQNAQNHPVTVVTARSTSVEEDQRFKYEHALLRLALEKSKKEYGDYELRFSSRMNLSRTLEASKTDALENFFFKTSYAPEYLEHNIYIPIPVDLGLVGYRVCFASEHTKKKIKKTVSLEELKTLTIGQGQGWQDVEILRHNGFKVVEVASYQNLFPMVAIDRFDLFCRGANEILAEWNAFNTTPDLAIDESVLLFYPFPRFFWTNKNNVEIAERIHLGLDRAYKDGSLKQVWDQLYLDSVNFARLAERKLYILENPLLDELSGEYQKYFFDPFTK